MEFIKRGDIYFQEKKYAKSLELFTNAILFDSSNYYPYLAKGIIYFQLTNYQEALNFLNQSLERNPKSFIAICFKANILQNCLYYEESLPLYKKAIELNPNSLLPNVNIAKSLERLHRFEEAISYYEKAISLSRNEGVYLNLFNCLQSTNQLDKLLLYLDSAIETSLILKKTNKSKYLDTFYCKKGEIFLQFGEFENAISYFEKSLQENNVRSLTYRFIALAHQGLDMFHDSISIFIKSIYFDNRPLLRTTPQQVKDYYRCQARLTVTYEMLGNSYFYQRSYKKAVEQYSNSFYYLDNYLNNQNTSIYPLNDVIMKRPLLHILTAISNFNLQNFKVAFQYFQSALFCFSFWKLHPNFNTSKSDSSFTLYKRTSHESQNVEKENYSTHLYFKPNNFLYVIHEYRIFSMLLSGNYHLSDVFSVFDNHFKRRDIKLLSTPLLPLSLKILNYIYFLPISKDAITKIPLFSSSTSFYKQCLSKMVDPSFLRLFALVIDLYNIYEVYDKSVPYMMLLMDLLCTDNDIPKLRIHSDDIISTKLSDIAKTRSFFESSYNSVQANVIESTRENTITYSEFQSYLFPLLPEITNSSPLILVLPVEDRSPERNTLCALTKISLKLSLMANFQLLKIVDILYNSQAYRKVIFIVEYCVKFLLKGLLSPVRDSISLYFPELVSLELPDHYRNICQGRRNISKDNYRKFYREHQMVSLLYQNINHICDSYFALNEFDRFIQFYSNLYDLYSHFHLNYTSPSTEKKLIMLKFISLIKTSRIEEAIAFLKVCKSRDSDELKAIVLIFNSETSNNQNDLLLQLLKEKEEEILRLKNCS